MTKLTDARTSVAAMRDSCALAVANQQQLPSVCRDLLALFDHPDAIWRAALDAEGITREQVQAWVDAGEAK